MATTTESGMISVSTFKSSLLFMLDEMFENVHGGFLDPGDSLLPTLDGLTAEQASVPVIGDGNSIASQVSHVIFYFDVSFRYMQGENPGKQDWSTAWQVVTVTDEEWDALRHQLRERQQTLLRLINDTPDAAFASEETVGGAMALLAHTAFHLGQIRHAMAMASRHAS